MPGVDLSVFDTEVTSFGASVHSGVVSPRGEMRLGLLVPYSQVPRVMPIMAHAGGVVFEFTVRRIPVEELPESGW